MQAIEASGKGKFLVDGYPRNEDNYSGWEKFMGDRCNVGLVLFFDCPEEVSVCTYSVLGCTLNVSLGIQANFYALSVNCLNKSVLIRVRVSYMCNVQLYSHKLCHANY